MDSLARLRYEEGRRKMIEQMRNLQSDRDRAREQAAQQEREDKVKTDAEKERQETAALAREFDKAINIQTRIKEQPQPKKVGNVRKPKPKDYAGRVSDAMNPRKSWLGD